jgi:hypothetical protein
MNQQEALIRALHNSLHSVSDAEERWRHRRRTGLNDEQLRFAIAAEYGIAGGAAIALLSTSSGFC